MSGALTALTVVTTLGCALVGGVFFAFSTFVMKGLGRLTPSQGRSGRPPITCARSPPRPPRRR